MTEKNPWDLSLGKEFLNLILKPPSLKGKIDELYFIKSKNFCSKKDPIKRMKRQAIDGRKYLQTS